jgi:ABC-type transport system substrate-binding protein
VLPLFQKIWSISHNFSRFGPIISVLLNNILKKWKGNHKSCDAWKINNRFFKRYFKNSSQVGVRALASDILEVTLKKPVVYFPSITTFMVTFPLRQDIIEKYGDNWTEPGKNCD